MNRQGKGAAQGATISEDGLYRYLLWRTIKLDGQQVLFKSKNEMKTVCFIMLNPSTADAKINDPTIRRCMGFAKTWEYDKLFVVNLFAYRTDDPRKLLKHIRSYNGQMEDVTCHSHNDTVISNVVEVSDQVIAAWGALNCEEFISRANDVAGNIFVGDLMSGISGVDRFVKCIGRTKYGYPRHPLMVRKEKELEVFNP